MGLAPAGDDMAPATLSPLEDFALGPGKAKSVAVELFQTEKGVKGGLSKL